MSTAQRLTHHLYCTYLCLKRETGLLMGTEKREPFQGDGLPEYYQKSHILEYDRCAYVS